MEVMGVICRSRTQSSHFRLMGKLFVLVLSVINRISRSISLTSIFEILKILILLNQIRLFCLKYFVCVYNIRLCSFFIYIIHKWIDNN